MKPMLRKILIIAMSLIMAFTIVPLLPSYASDIEGTDNTGEAPLAEPVEETESTVPNNDGVTDTNEGIDAPDETVNAAAEVELQDIEVCDEVQILADKLQKGAYLVKPTPSPNKIVNTETIYQARAKVTGKSKIKIKWTAKPGVKGYVVQRLKGKKWKTIKTLKGYKKTSYTNKGLKKGKYYQYRVKSFVYKKKGKKYKKVYSDYGIPVGAVAGKSKAKTCNAYSVTPSTYSVVIKDRVPVNISAAPVRENDKSIVNGSIRYVSSNPQIAAVDNNGRITGNHAGRCAVYAVAHNGVTAKISVTVEISPSAVAAEIPVLTYHKVVSDDLKQRVYSNNEWVASESSFEQQMKYISDNGFKTISLQEFEQWYSGRISLPENSVVLTIDDGDASLYNTIYPILKKYDLKATAFIIGVATGETTGASIGMDKIQEIQTDYTNLNFQSHSWNLHYMNGDKGAILYRSENQLVEDFQKMKNDFGFEYMAYPYGYCTNYALKALPRAGYKMAFAFRQYDYARRTDNRYNVFRIKISGKTSMGEFTRWLNRY